MILVDTSIWIRVIRRESREEGRELDRLIEADEVAATDIVIAEVLQGTKSESDFQEWQDKLGALHFFHADASIWQAAARRSFELRRRGLATPLSDLVIAMVALEHDLLLYAHDDHFARLPELKLHRT